MTVGIIYGWSEGPWQGKMLRATLRREGFSVTTRLNEADILIAHSGGCYLLPKESRANTILLVGLPYNPDKHILHRLKDKIKHEVKDTWWYKKTFYNSFYFISQPFKWYYMWRAWKNNMYPTLSKGTVIAVRNEHDPFMHPTDSEAFINNQDWNFKKLPGHHDDLWINPERYVSLIKENIEIQK